ncbi:MAG TPA: PAS domain S-box protein [Gemmatales bacterium]|nr:PAS domain S-box protein [Gemmatales bacterium]
MTMDVVAPLAAQEPSQATLPLPLLLSNASAAVVQLDPQGRVQLWNQAAEKLFGWRCDEVLGKPSPSVPNHLWEDNQAWFLRCLGGQTMSGIQLQRRRKDGSTINVHAWAWPVRNQHGLLLGVMKMFFPVGERAKEQETTANQSLIQKTEQAQRFHSAIVSLSKTDYPSLESALHTLTTVASQTLNVERVSIWLFNEARNAIHCACLYERSHDRFSSGTVFTAENFPRYFESLEKCRTIAASQARTDHRTSEYREAYLEPLGITSMLDVPVRLHGHEIGIVCHEHVGSVRDWTLEEQGFAAAIADFVSLSYENQEHAKAERDLRQSQATLHSFVESTTARMGLAHITPNNDLQIVWCNSAILAAWPSLQVGRLLSECNLEPELIRLWSQAAQEALNGQHAVRFDIREARTGCWLEFCLTPVEHHSGHLERRISFIIEDKTDYRKAVDELYYREQLLAAVINGSPVGIQVFDQSGTLRRQNPAMQQLAGKLNVPNEVGEFNILQTDQAITPDDRHMAEQALSGEIIEQPKRVINVDAGHNGPLVMDTIYYPVKGQHSDTAGLACFHRDVSERYRFEDQLQQTQRLESLGLLAGTIAHDFNGLLTAIYGFIDLAQEELPTTHMARTYLQSGLQAAMRATDLTQQLLAYAGRGKREIKPFDLSVLVLEVTELLRSMLKQHGTLQMNLSPSLPDITGDSTQIRQLVMNLISNAAESHASDRGVVNIKTDVVNLLENDLARCQVAATDAVPGPYVILQVSDQGSGIPPQVLKRIFDPFFTTKTKGRGLGLAAIVGIIRGHKAALMVETHIGKGTMFSVYLPVVSLS